MTTTGEQARSYPRLRLGTAPDSWGTAGYSWIELGPYGYLPTDPARLRDELAKRDLRLDARYLVLLPEGYAAADGA